jgi:hypothetical protein
MLLKESKNYADYFEQLQSIRGIETVRGSAMPGNRRMGR